jgi:hypothetical protein
MLELLVTENRWLVFSQGRPSVALNKYTPPPSDPYYSTSLRTTSALLFRFSALTLNAHAIHIDPQYTKEEYGLPGLLVHGPLTFVLMMEVLARGLDQYARATGLDSPRLQVKRVVYRNLMPILVGEETSVCCKPVNDVHGKEGQMLVGEEGQWEVWVQKLVNGQPSLCVKAAVTVAYLPVSTRVKTDDRRRKDSSAPRVRRISQSDDRAKPEAERRPRAG